MRIAMVGPFGFHPNKTMRGRALNLARPLVRQGHEVCLFMPPWQTPEEAERRWEEEGVEIRYISLRGGIPGITRQLIRETLAWKPTAVHCFKPKAYSGFTAWWLWQFHRRHLRLVTDSDDWEGWGGWNDLAAYSPLQKRLFAWQERWGITHCHTLTVASRVLQSIAWSHGLPREKVLYIPNGPGIAVPPSTREELSELGSEKRRELGVGERPILLLYSRLFEFDPERLLAVLMGVKTAVPDLLILSIGAGLYAEHSAEFRQLLAATPLLPDVLDLGWVEEEALPALLATADVAIYLLDDTLLNRTKCPMKLADLVALGVPVVAEAVGQASEYVQNGRTGFLRPSGDVAGLITDLIHLLQHPEERERFSAAARTHAEQHFRWEILTNRLLQAYA